MITASLVGGGVPPLVQIVVDETPDGEGWTLTGSAGGLTWTVPGGVGVGDGEQLTIADNRTPGNIPIVYTFTAETVTEVADAVTVPMPELVLQSLDGQVSLPVSLLDGALSVQFPSRKSRFVIPGRRRPVTRFTVSGDREGSWPVLVPVAESGTFDALIMSGAPVLYRCGEPIFDFPLVGVIDLDTPTAVGYSSEGLRVWDLPYVTVDDPFMDQRFGAFPWDFFDTVNGGRTWDDFDALFSGSTWNEFDTTDWATL
jgi:hypothetical protein